MNRYPIFLLAAAALLMGAIAGCSNEPVDPSSEIEASTNAVNEARRNRTYRLALPAAEADGRFSSTDQIDLASVMIFKLMEPGILEADDIANVAIYTNSTDYRAWSEATIDFSQPHTYGPRWHELTKFEPLFDADGGLEAIALLPPLLEDDVLAVVYAVVDQAGNVVWRVGDDPRLGSPTQALPGEENLFYRMMLLEAVTR